MRNYDANLNIEGSLHLMLIELCKNERYKPISSYHADSSVVRAFVLVVTEIATVASDTFLTVIHSEALITP